ncbi:MAG: hypothetical protein LBQ55_05820 [Treponema sp.]|jgi:hypothetical protein|nr:hypothetical protein [Treponema sp.]
MFLFGGYSALAPSQTLTIDGPTLRGKDSNKSPVVLVAANGRLEMKSGKITGNKNDDNTDNTTTAGNTWGHAVYYNNDNPYYYRDDTLNETDDISTDPSKLPASGSAHNWTKK